MYVRTTESRRAEFLLAYGVGGRLSYTVRSTNSPVGMRSTRRQGDPPGSAQDALGVPQLPLPEPDSTAGMWLTRGTAHVSQASAHVKADSQPAPCKLIWTITRRARAASLVIANTELPASTPVSASADCSKSRARNAGTLELHPMSSTETPRWHPGLVAVESCGTLRCSVAARTHITPEWVGTPRRVQ